MEVGCEDRVLLALHARTNLHMNLIERSIRISEELKVASKTTSAILTSVVQSFATYFNVWAFLGHVDIIWLLSNVMTAISGDCAQLITDLRNLLFFSLHNLQGNKSCTEGHIYSSAWPPLFLICNLNGTGLTLITFRMNIMLLGAL
jgi:hypothetical protein